ncbi:MAG TPA: pseudouridine synthase [Clostridiales bacterium]|nr:pseudouridine synthase [Clostridiales bacterium]HRT82346.1 pseudouridine synthase [Oscillospiraceae bacterium]
MEEKIRLQKYISDCGITSRRKAEELIRQGEVLVNGVPAQIGDKISPTTDKVEIKGYGPVKQTRQYRYIALNKPRGYVTTLKDELGRKCVADLITDVGSRVYPIGRLDKDSEGLLLLTDDGDFHNRVEHPTFMVPKYYRVTVRPKADEEKITRMMAQAAQDSVADVPVKISVIEHFAEKSILEFILSEGKNRQIRNLCESVNLEVARLKRVAVGKIKLGMLEPGKWRDLTTQEVSSFDKKKKDNNK